MGGGHFSAFFGSAKRDSESVGTRICVYFLASAARKGSRVP